MIEQIHIMERELEQIQNVYTLLLLENDECEELKDTLIKREIFLTNEIEKMRKSILFYI